LQDARVCLTDDAIIPPLTSPALLNQAAIRRDAPSAEARRRRIVMHAPMPTRAEPESDAIARGTRQIAGTHASRCCLVRRHPRQCRQITTANQ